MKPKVIAYYLPQYHPCKENDEWWGKGFTERTNVGKAKPVFKGQDQPRVPTELGYYDLRMPQVREQQAQMAREAGVTGFMYWHYWFGNGRTLLEDIFDEVLASGKPDFPFCLGWANHPWYSKTWNKDGSTTNKLLMPQEYPGLEDEKMHFAFLLKAFNDKRYIKIGGKPFFLVYDPMSMPQSYIDHLKEWAKDAGFPGIYLVGNISKTTDHKADIIAKGFDAVVFQRLNYMNPNSMLSHMGKLGRFINYHIWKPLTHFLSGKPTFAYNYEKIWPQFIGEKDKAIDEIPQLFPQWDHTPRSGRNGVIYYNSTPELFYKHVRAAMDAIRNKPVDNQVLILKSWNEWGEGNYMEPDLTHGRGYINALRKALDEG